jgi:hypothetical protein
LCMSCVRERDSYPLQHAGFNETAGLTAMFMGPARASSTTVPSSLIIGNHPDSGDSDTNASGSKNVEM